MASLGAYEGNPYLFWKVPCSFLGVRAHELNVEGPWDLVTGLITLLIIAANYISPVRRIVSMQPV